MMLGKCSVNPTLSVDVGWENNFGVQGVFVFRELVAVIEIKLISTPRKYVPCLIGDHADTFFVVAFSTEG